MTPGIPSAESAAQKSGAVAEVLRLFGSCMRHLQALAGLAAEEGRDAVALYVRLAIMLGAALVLGAFGYIFVLLTIAFAVEMLFGLSWVWILLALAVLHLLVAFLCALHVRTHFRTPVFRSTAEEIRKDFDSIKRG